MILFINPIGGKKKGVKIWEKDVQPLMTIAGIETKMMVTERAGHIRDTLLTVDLSDLHVSLVLARLTLFVRFNVVETKHACVRSNKAYLSSLRVSRNSKRTCIFTCVCVCVCVHYLHIQKMAHSVEGLILSFSNEIYKEYKCYRQKTEIHARTSPEDRPGPSVDFRS